MFNLCYLIFILIYTPKMMLKWAPTFYYFLNISLACYISVPSRVSLSIGDRRILHLLRIILQLNFNDVWLFFIQTNQTWIRYVTLKRNYSQKCVILVLSHLLYIPKEITIIHKRSHLNASSFKPNKTNRGCVKYLTVCWRVDCWLYAQRFFILHAKKY